MDVTTGSDGTYLDIFSGAGGQALTAQRLLGLRCVGYVENNNDCAQVLRARQNDGSLHVAPIYGDVRAFLAEGYACEYRGLASHIVAGPPCQPFSVAGKRRGRQDERDMWPALLDVVGVVAPRVCLFECVATLLRTPEWRDICDRLAALGYDASWAVVGAPETGVPHKRRDRLWVRATLVIPASGARDGVPDAEPVPDPGHNAP